MYPTLTMSIIFIDYLSLPVKAQYVAAHTGGSS